MSDKRRARERSSCEVDVEEGTSVNTEASKEQTCKLVTVVLVMIDDYCWDQGRKVESVRYPRACTAATSPQRPARAPTITRLFSVSDCDFKCFSECSGLDADQTELLLRLLEC